MLRLEMSNFIAFVGEIKTMQKTFRDINRHQFRIHVLLFDSFCFRPLSYFSPQNIMQDEKPKVALKDVLVNSMQRIWRAPVIFLA